METLFPVQIRSPSSNQVSSSNKAESDPDASSSNATAAVQTPPRARAPRTARQTGFRIRPLRHPSGVSTRPISRPAVSQLDYHPQSKPGRISPVDSKDLVSETNPVDSRSRTASASPTTRDQPPKSPSGTAMTLLDNRESEQRPRDRGRTPRKAHRTNFPAQRSSADPEQSRTDPGSSKLPDQPEPDAVTTADTYLDPNALPPPATHTERSAAQSAAALRDIFERMRRSRERGSDHTPRLPIAQWRADRAGPAVETALSVLQLQSVETGSTTSRASQVVSVPAAGQSELPAAASAMTSPGAAWVRQDDRLYRERGTPRKARNAPFTIKPLSSGSVIPTPGTTGSSKLGETGNTEK